MLSVYKLLTPKVHPWVELKVEWMKQMMPLGYYIHCAKLEERERDKMKYCGTIELGLQSADCICNMSQR